MNLNTENLKNKDLLFAIVEKLRPNGGGQQGYPDSRGEYWTFCPFHSDQHIGNFSFNSMGFHCFACGASGGLHELGQKLGLTTNPRNQERSYAGLTLTHYAEAKQVPEDFLKSLGIYERKKMGVPQLYIPYFDQEGQLLGTRIRSAMIGPNRFYWQKGSQPSLYGLQRLTELLHNCTTNGDRSKYIILVEGESDAQTLWLYDCPALGVPGATTWQPDWAQELFGLEVFVWQEPDEGGKQFVQRIGNDLPDIKILIPPENRKDISECHLAGDDIPQVMKQVMDAAVSFTEQQSEVHIKETEELFRIAQPLLTVDVLQMVVEECRALGVVGEEKNLKLLYLALTSRLLERPISVAVKGVSSGGKSYILNVILKLFPPTAYYKISSMSDKALFYLEESFVHRILVMYEATGFSSDAVSYVIRSLLSEGHIRHITVESTGEGLHNLVVEKDGPTGFITTTTLIELHPENETRILSINVVDNPEQSKRILKRIAESAMSPDVHEIPESFLAAQSWIERGGITDVVIPFAGFLADLTRAVAVRIRRDFTLVINLIKTVAILYQLQRQVDSKGRIIATIDDYQMVYELVSEIVDEGAESSVKPIVRETVAAVQRLLQPDYNNEYRTCKNESGVDQACIDNTTLAKELGLDSSSTSRRVKLAIKDGFLENLETRRGARARIVLGRKLPEDQFVLPPPVELKNKWIADSENDANVQHSSEDRGGRHE